MLPFPITDSHLHFWHKQKFCYPWLESAGALNRNFLPADFAKACDALAVGALVVVECCNDPCQQLAEAQWFAELARQETRIRGLVCGAPLEAGRDAALYLRMLSRNPLVKGVRRNIQFQDDPDFCLRKSFIEGVRLLAGYDWTFDICAWHLQLSRVHEMVAQCPEVRFVLDHLGKPDIAQKTLLPWQDAMKRLAELPNVSCKISSLTTYAPDSWRLDDLAPYVDTVLEAFGCERILFGSDWPVSSRSASYPSCVSTLLELMHGVSEREKRRVFAENAIRVYRLEVQ